MRILKPVGEELELDGRKYNLIFNVNVIDQLQETYDMAIVDILNSMFPKNGDEKEVKMNSYKKVAYIAQVLINENIKLHNKENEEKWEPITCEYIAEMLDNITTIKLALLMLKSFNGTNSKSETNEKNVKSEQTKK